MTTLERDWQRDIIRLARTLGWKVAHFRPAQTSKGWRTSVAADGAGFPDLILVRDRLIAAELKNEKGRVTEEQAEWIAALEVAERVRDPNCRQHGFPTDEWPAGHPLRRHRKWIDRETGELFTWQEAFARGVDRRCRGETPRETEERLYRESLGGAA